MPTVIAQSVPICSSQCQTYASLCQLMPTCSSWCSLCRLVPYCANQHQSLPTTARQWQLVPVGADLRCLKVEAERSVEDVMGILWLLYFIEKQPLSLCAGSRPHLCPQFPTKQVPMVLMNQKGRPSPHFSCLEQTRNFIRWKNKSPNYVFCLHGSAQACNVGEVHWALTINHLE